MGLTLSSPVCYNGGTEVADNPRVPCETANEVTAYKAYSQVGCEDYQSWDKR
jgi:hypothetical protein